MKLRNKWVGLWLMGTAVAVAILVGGLAFAGVLHVDRAITFISLCAVLGFIPGFALHIAAVVQQWRQNTNGKR